MRPTSEKEANVRQTYVRKEANVRLRPTSEKRQTVTSVAANNYLGTVLLSVQSTVALTLSGDNTKRNRPLQCRPVC